MPKAAQPAPAPRPRREHVVSTTRFTRSCSGQPREGGVEVLETSARKPEISVCLWSVFSSLLVHTAPGNHHGSPASEQTAPGGNRRIRGEAFSRVAFRRSSQTVPEPRRLDALGGKDGHTLNYNVL